MVRPYSDLEAYTIAVACFSISVVNALWEAAGIPIPATMQPVIPEVTNADLGLPEGSMTAGSAAPDDPLDPPSAIEGGIRRVLGGVRGIAAGAVPAAPNVAVIAERFGLRLPSLARPVHDHDTGIPVLRYRSGNCTTLRFAGRHAPRFHAKIKGSIEVYRMSFLSALMGAASTAQSVGVFDPALRLAGYLSNFVYPNKLPDPDSLFAAHRAQLITTGQLEGFLAAQGVSVSHVTLGRPAPEIEDPDDLTIYEGSVDRSASAARCSAAIRQPHRSAVPPDHHDRRMARCAACLRTARPDLDSAGGTRNKTNPRPGRPGEICIERRLGSTDRRDLSIRRRVSGIVPITGCHVLVAMAMRRFRQRQDSQLNKSTGRSFIGEHTGRTFQPHAIIRDVPATPAWATGRFRCRLPGNAAVHLRQS